MKHGISSSVVAFLAQQIDLGPFALALLCDFEAMTLETFTKRLERRKKSTFVQNK